MLRLVCVICVYAGASIGVCVPECLVLLLSPTMKRRAIEYQYFNKSTGSPQI